MLNEVVQLIIGYRRRLGGGKGSSRMAKKKEIIIIITNHIKINVVDVQVNIQNI